MPQPNFSTLTYRPTHLQAADRYSFGVAFISDGTDPFEQRIAYVKGGDMVIRKDGKPVGTWLDIAAWPYSQKVAGVEVPANSIWMGIHWGEETWPMVAKGDAVPGLTLSFGTRAAELMPRLHPRSLGKARENDMTKKTAAAPLAEALSEALQKVASTPGSELPNLHVGETGNAGTGERRSELPAPPKAPTPKPNRRSDGKPVGPQLDPKLIDHQPKLDTRFQQFLAGLESTLGAARYREMLVAIAEFNSMVEQATDQAGHKKALDYLATKLRGIMQSEADIVKLLKMGRLVSVQQLGDGGPIDMYDSEVTGLAGHIAGLVKRAMNTNVLSSFTGEGTDDLGRPLKG